jgi:hypothetical protein
MKRTCCIFWLLLISFCSAASSYNVFEENGSVGLKDDQGNVLIPARYEALGWSNGDFSILQNVVGYKLDGHWGLISLDNRTITKPDYEELVPGHANLIIGRKKSALSLRIVAGCLTTTGREVVPFQYDGISLHSFRAIVFTKVGNQYRYGLIDLENKTLIPQQYRNIHSIGSLRYAVENFDRKTALYSENGKQITGFDIDSISAFKKDHAIIFQGTRQGLIDRQGSMKAEPAYREIRIDDDGSLHGRMADEWFFLDGLNKLIKKTSADDIMPLGNDLLRISSGGAIQLTDYTLTPRLDNRVTALGGLINGKAVFARNGKYGILRKNGTVLLNPTYDSLFADSNHFIGRIWSDGKHRWSLLDSAGRVISTKTYDAIYPFAGSLFPVVNRLYWGALDETGHEVMACAYDSIVQRMSNRMVVKFRGAYGIIDTHESWLVTPRSNHLMIINEDRFLEYTPKITYLKAIDGQTIYFTENQIEVHDDYLIEHLPSGTVWQIDLDGTIANRQVQLDGPIEKILPASEGLRAIKKNGQYGFVDDLGRLRIANRYDDVQSFQEDLAAIRIRGHWGFINHEDNIAVQPVYDAVTPFVNGLSCVTQKGLQGLIDKMGNLVLHARYDSIRVLEDGYVIVQQERSWGLANTRGSVLINPKYETLSVVGSRFAVVSREGKYGVITTDGISTIPMIYDGITYDSYQGLFLAKQRSPWLPIRP